MWIEQTFVLKSGHVINFTTDVSDDVETHIKKMAVQINQKPDHMVTYAAGKQNEGNWSIKNSEIAAYNARKLD